ncbi:hypothetical protein [Bacillus sp. OAE603]|uniref:hypothetical protein n=1 Tax=Gottfriedia sp. OAE603 TaxID=2663872 RepID=UPI00178AAE8F
MTVLIIFCFILFLLLCVWNVYLTMQLSKYKEIETSLFHIKQETEDVLYSFIEEWKEENEQFLNKLSDNSNNNKQVEKAPPINRNESFVSKKPNLVKRFDFVEKQTEIDYKDLLLNDSDQNNISERIQNREKPVAESVKPTEKLAIERPSNSLLDEIISMKNDGLTTDEIAKKLDKGKTEIELMLKLRQ